VSNPANQNEPTWPVMAAWLLSALLVALVGLALARAESWTEAQVLTWSAGLFCVFGIAFLLASRCPDHPWLFRYLMTVAHRQRRWFRLGGFITRGEPHAAGWLCLAIGVLLAALARLL
jgi:hypothetical protein